jgi:hypothetical protein
LNALANAAYSAASSAIDNTTNLHEFMAVHLHLASLTPSGSPYIAIYLLPAFDGATYVDGGASVVPPASSLVAVMDLSTSAAAKERSAVFVIPPASFKLVLYNSAGPSLAGTLNTLKGNTFTTQDV